MSIKVMTMIWDYYPEGGSELLLALALADIAQDDGSRIYPGVKFMASKTRMSERNVQYLLAKIRDRGILKVVKEGGLINGVNHTTRYRLDLVALTAHPLDRVQTLHPVEEPVDKSPETGDKISTGVQPSAGGGANQRQKGVQPVAPNTSLSVKNRTPDDQSQGQNNTQTAPIAEPSWWDSNQGMLDMAEKVGVSTKGLTSFQLKAKINEALNRTKH